VPHSLLPGKNIFFTILHAISQKFNAKLRKKMSHIQKIILQIKKKLEKVKKAQNCFLSIKSPILVRTLNWILHETNTRLIYVHLWIFESFSVFKGFL
jgi:hypothetical protein